MSDIFNIRSFVENQVEKLSTPTNILVDKFRQTVDQMKFPFASPNTTEQQQQQEQQEPQMDDIIIIESNSSNSCPSESVSSCSVSSNNSTQNYAQNLKILNQRFSRAYQQPILKRHVSEINERNSSSSRPIYHENPTVDIQILLNQTKSNTDRSRSLIRQSTDTTCTYPIRYPIRRMESIEIPGLNGVKSIRYIQDNLGKLEPNLYKKQISHNDPTYNCGQITFTVYYNQSLTSLIIKILSMDHLSYRDLNRKILPNPFIKLTLLPDRRKKFQTKVFKHIQSTDINEIFQYQITYEQLCKRILLLSVYDFRRSSKRNLIGTVKVDEIYSISDLTSHEILLTKNIVPGTESDPDLGELTVSLCYLPNAKRVTVTIVKANSLKPMDINGKSDPYVKVILLINGKKIRKKKTSVLSNTLNPVYNESLEFDLSCEELENTDFIFKVIDYDRVGSNELIGCIGIGIHFDGINRDHWYQMLEYPHIPIVQNYNLRETIPTIICPNSTMIQPTKKDKNSLF